MKEPLQVFTYASMRRICFYHNIPAQKDTLVDMPHQKCTTTPDESKLHEYQMRVYSVGHLPDRQAQN